MNLTRNIAQKPMNDDDDEMCETIGTSHGDSRGQSEKAARRTVDGSTK